MTKIKVWIHGIDGKMGTVIREQLLSDSQLDLVGGSGHQYLFLDDQETHALTNLELTAHLSKVDVIVDFTNAEGNRFLYEAVKASPSAHRCVLGTTGLSAEQRKQWKTLCKENQATVLFAPNTSLGVLITMKMGQELAKVLHPQGFDIEILETHHRQKLDAPSGTAKFLADKLCEVTPLKPQYNRTGKRETDELGVVALRGGSVFGEHEIRFMGDFEEISLSHRALNRSLFAKGAVLLAKWISKAEKSQHYGLDNIDLSDIGPSA